MHCYVLKFNDNRHNYHQNRVSASGNQLFEINSILLYCNRTYTYKRKTISFHNEVGKMFTFKMRNFASSFPQHVGIVSF